MTSSALTLTKSAKSAQILQLPAPAKLNLMLHITGQRNDGYHLLQTVFQLIDYGDSLYLELRDDGHIVLESTIQGLPAEENLIVKAAKALQTTTQSSLGATIRIDKILPMGGGIGGGSSNAATTLLGLNHLWNTQLSLDQLAAIGLPLGADVPVFVRGHSAWAEGIGEQLQAIDIPEQWYFVIKPHCSVVTAQIFSHKQLTRNTSPIKIAAFFEQGGHNDCEVVVRQLYPEVDAAFDWLNEHTPAAISAQLTGTGACVFVSLSSKQMAVDLMDKLPNAMDGFIAKGINTSPVHQTLGLDTR